MRKVKRNMINLGELPDDLLIKILSLLPTKEAAPAATSVLSKRWCCLWKQQDVDYVEIGENCSPDYIFRHTPNSRHWLPSTYSRIFDERTGEVIFIEDPPPPPEKWGLLV